MKKTSTFFVLLFSVVASLNAQLLLWRDGSVSNEYTIESIDSIKFHKPQLLLDTIRLQPTEGALPHQFSVGEGSTVFFSQGNLRYKASTKEWAFASSQTSRIGADNANISENYDGWIDLFGWGTSGYKDSQPYISVMDYTKYPNLKDIANTNYDWGVYNKISNGGNQAGLWRTLTADEWLYIFYSRANADSLFAFANIAGVNGLIILPDNWQLPEGAVFTPSVNKGLMSEGKYFWNVNGDNFKHNKYTLSQWQLLQEAGAVFLPAAGYRRETEIVDVNEYGVYWTASGRDDNFAYRCIFYSTILSPGASNITYFYGYSVRLVQDAIRLTQPQGEMIIYKSNSKIDKYFVNQVDSLTYKK